MDLMMTPEQVAARLQVTKLTVYGWLRSGQLRGMKLGRLWRVRSRDLEAFLDARADQAAWEERFTALLARADAQVPEHVPEEEVEADAAAAVARARELMRARGR